jgi:hypothetical protein
MKRIHPFSFPFFFLLALFFTTACNTSDQAEDLLNPGSAKSNRGLSGLWYLTNGPLDAGLSMTDSKIGPAYINLLEDGKLLGHSSRNILGGFYASSEGNKIDLSITLSTRVADTPFSSWFMEGLELAETYQLIDNDQRLHLKSTNSGRLELQFVRLNSVAKPVLISSKTFGEGSKEEVRINSIAQIGNILTINATHSGGCVEQSPELVWGEQLSKSIPPVTPLKLVFAKADDCEALVTKTYFFDLENLFKATRYDELSIPIEGWKENAVRVKKQ